MISLFCITRPLLEGMPARFLAHVLRPGSGYDPAVTGVEIRLKRWFWDHGRRSR